MADEGRVDQPEREWDEFRGIDDGPSSNGRGHFEDGVPIDPEWTDSPSSPRLDADTSGDERLAAGWRTGVSKQEAREKSARPTPPQILDDFPLDEGRFRHTQFLAFMKDGLKSTRGGEMEIVLRVPFDCVPLVLPMWKAVGIPLSVDIQAWTPFLEDEQKEAAATRGLSA